MWKYFRGNYVIPSQNWVKTPQKKVVTAIWDYIRPKFVGFIRADRPFFIWSSSVQISMGEGAKSWIGDENSRWRDVSPLLAFRCNWSNAKLTNGFVITRNNLCANLLRLLLQSLGRVLFVIYHTEFFNVLFSLNTLYFLCSSIYGIMFSKIAKAFYFYIKINLRDCSVSIGLASIYEHENFKWKEPRLPKTYFNWLSQTFLIFWIDYQNS